MRLNTCKISTCGKKFNVSKFSLCKKIYGINFHQWHALVKLINFLLVKISTYTVTPITFFSILDFRINVCFLPMTATYIVLLYSYSIILWFIDVPLIPFPDGISELRQQPLDMQFGELELVLATLELHNF